MDKGPEWKFFQGNYPKGQQVYEKMLNITCMCCCCLVTQSCLTLCNPMDPYQTSLSLTISWSLLKFMFIASVMPSSHLMLCRPLLLPPSIFPSIRVFSSESVLPIRWPEYWSFSSTISPSSEYSGLISFRTDCFDLLAIQGTLKSLLQQPQFFDIHQCIVVALSLPKISQFRDKWYDPLLLTATVLLVEEAFAGCFHKMEETEARNCSSRSIATFLSLAVSWQ